MTSLPSDVISGPPAFETTDLHFKLIQRSSAVPVHENYSYVNLITVTNAYGLSLFGCKGGFFGELFYAYMKLADIARTDSLGKTEQKVFIPVDLHQITHLAVNCDENLLAVAGNSVDAGCIAIIYSLSSLQSGSLAAVNKFVFSSKPGTFLTTDLEWNPTSPSLISACLSDGSLVMADVKDSGIDISTLPPAAGVKCFCWSPKGKQLVVGSEDGKLTQYKPDLKAAKSLPAPDLYNGSPTVVNVIWLSNFQFAAFFRDRKSSETSSAFVIINAEKNQPITYINYGEIMYESMATRPHQFYFIHLAAWNLLLVTAYDSVEVAAFFMEPGGNKWKMLSLPDSSRVEMPLSSTNDETYPLGMAIDLSSGNAVSWGEQSLMPMPRLLLLSTEGHLCVYDVVSLISGSPPICTPPTRKVADSFFHSKDTAIQEPKKTESALPVMVVPPSQSLPSVSSPTAPVKVSADKQERSPVTTPTDLACPNFEDLSPTKEPELDDSVLDAAIQAEIVYINEQLINLRTDSAMEIASEHVLGSQEKYASIVGQLDALSEFQIEVEETTSSQAEEISEIKMETLELVARAEDACMMNKRRTSQIFNQLRRTQRLDPVTARTSREIEAHRTYVESQISQIGEHLDRQWEQYQNSCRKDVRKMMKTPFIDDILKTLDIQKKLLCHQKAEVDRLEKEVERLSLRSGRSHYFRDSFQIRSTDVTRLADSFLGLSVGEFEPGAEDVIALIAKKKEEQYKACELSASELTSLLDRFLDAQVIQVSRIKYFSDREAHRKQVAERLKKSAQILKQKREEKKSEANVALPIMEQINFIPASKSSLFSQKTQPSTPPSMVSSAGNFSAGTIISRATAEPSRGLSQTPAGGSMTHISPVTFEPPEGAGNLPAGTTISPVTAGGVIQNKTLITPAFGLQTRPVLPPSSTNVSSGFESKEAITPRTSSGIAFGSFNFNNPIPEVPSKPSGEAAKITSSEASPKINTFGSLNFSPLSASERFSFSSAGFGVTPPVSAKTIPVSSVGTEQSGNKQSPDGKGPSESGTKNSPTPKLSDTPQSLPVSTTAALPDAKSAASTTSSLINALQQTLQAPISQATVSQSGPKFSAVSGSGFASSDGLFKTVTCTANAGSVFKAATTPMTGPAVSGPTTTSEAASAVASLSTSALPVTTSPAVASKTSGIFGGVLPTNKTGIFGSASPMTTTSILGSASPATTKSVFGSASSTATTSVFGSAGPVTTTSIFGSANPVTTTSVLGAASSTTTTSAFGSASPVTTKSIFGSASPTTTHSVFGSASPATTTSVFGSASSTTTTSIFGSSSQVATASVCGAASSTTTTNAFGSASPVTTKSVFGSASPATTSSVFGSASSTATQSVFGSASQVTTASIFGSAGSTTTTSAFGSAIPATTSSVFGSASPAPTTSIFGSASSASTTSAFGSASPVTTKSVFGSASSTTTQSVFGSASPATTTTIFGSASSTTTTSAFGSASPATTSSVFGSASPTTAAVFGSAITATTTTGSLFGSNFVPPSSQTGIFGGASQTSSSPFGASLNQTTNMFGQVLGVQSPATGNAQNVFGQVTPSKTAFDNSGSIFGNTTPTSSSGSIFGGTNSSVFGQKSSGLFSSASSSTGLFGQPTTTSSIFGGSAFGTASSPGLFGNTSTTTTSFGSSAFGNKPVIGQSLFGQNTSTSFGGANTSSSSGSLFGGPAAGTSTFSSGSFSGSGGLFGGTSSPSAQPTFGSAPVFSKPAGGFGSPPVFGGSPSGGAFGGSTFGGAPVFGSPQKVFGTPTSEAGFGTQQATGFEAIANQNTVGFGNLAQMAGQQSSGFGAGFPSQNIFGNQQPTGSSFSSWR